MTAIALSLRVLSTASKSSSSSVAVAGTNGKFRRSFDNFFGSKSTARTWKKTKISIFYDQNPFKSDADDGAFQRTVMSLDADQSAPWQRLRFVGS
jgi:hypothetical protein